MSFSEDEAQFWVAYHNCKMGEATIREDVGVAVTSHIVPLPPDSSLIHI